MPFNIIKLNSSGKYLIDQTSTQYWDNELYEKNKVLNFKERGFDDIEKKPEVYKIIKSPKNIIRKIFNYLH